MNAMRANAAHAEAERRAERDRPVDSCDEIDIPAIAVTDLVCVVENGRIVDRDRPANDP